MLFQSVHLEIISTTWASFWRIVMPLEARPLWFRFTVCQSYLLLSDTFLFIVLRNGMFGYKYCLFSVLGLSPNRNDLQRMVFQLPQPSLSHDDKLWQLLSCTLLCIWRHHWNYVLNGRPFMTSIVVVAVSSALSYLFIKRA